MRWKGTSQTVWLTVQSQEGKGTDSSEIVSLKLWLGPW